MIEEHVTAVGGGGSAAGTAGRLAWRVWAPALLTILIMMAAVTYRDDNVWVPPTSAQLILILHGAVALLFRRRWPVPVAVVAVLAGCALPLAAPHLVLIDVAAVVAAYTVAIQRPRPLAWTVAIAGALALTAASAPWQPGGLWNIHSVLPANYMIIAVAVGDAMRTRRALLAELHDRAEREAGRRVREERIRIARDLHDVVAHHITLVNAQAGVAHHLMRSHPDRAVEALAGIRETSRTALDELRATVGLLRQDDDPPPSRQPAPTFAALDDLIDAVRRAGLAVAVTRTGPARPLPGAADLAAYRIVQEALTNARKHGTAREAEVDLQYEDAHLRIIVRNPAEAGRRGDGTGHGLIGMRERAEAAGGTCTATLTAGHFTIEAVLPTTQS